MTLYLNPEQHAANPPESWRVERVESRGSRPLWALHIDRDAPNPYRTFGTKREAEAERDNPQSFPRRLYVSDGAWYAGHTPAGHKSWEACKAEQDRTAARWGTVAPYRRGTEQSA